MSLNYDDIPLIEPEEPEEPGFALPPLAELKWLCVDLDGTLAEPLWTAQNPTNRIGDPIKLNVVKARYPCACRRFRRGRVWGLDSPGEVFTAWQ
jgi:hypothetical protein